MKVTFCPETRTTGIISFAAWSGAAFQEAMTSLFRPRENEKITEVVIEPDGIRAIFEYVRTTPANSNGGGG